MKVDDNAATDAISHSTSTEVKLDLPKSSGAIGSSVTAELSKSAFGKLSDAKKNLVLTNDQASIVLPANVVKQVADQNGETVKIQVDKVASSTLPVDEKTQKLKTSVYDFSILIGKDGKEEKYTKFSEPVTIKLSVKGQTFEDKRKVASFYFDDNAKKWVYVGGKISGDDFVFTTSHFSRYAVLKTTKRLLTFKTIGRKMKLKYWLLV